MYLLGHETSRNNSTKYSGGFIFDTFYCQQRCGVCMCLCGSVCGCEERLWRRMVRALEHNNNFSIFFFLFFISVFLYFLCLSIFIQLHFGDFFPLFLGFSLLSAFLFGVRFFNSIDYITTDRVKFIFWTFFFLGSSIVDSSCSNKNIWMVFSDALLRSCSFSGGHTIASSHSSVYRLSMSMSMLIYK